MKKICVIIIGFVIFSFGLLNTSNVPLYADIPRAIKVITDQAKVFAAPDITSEIIITLDYHDNANVLAESSNENFSFYKIDLSDRLFLYSEGYILKGQTIDIKLEGPTLKLQSNATVKSLNGKESKLYNFVNETYTEISTKLENKSKIRILNGYNSNMKYTKIQYEFSGEILIAYILTTEIDVKGVNTSLIIGISAAVTCVILITLVLGIKGKKKKNKK